MDRLVLVGVLALAASTAAVEGYAQTPPPRPARPADPVPAPETPRPARAPRALEMPGVPPAEWVIAPAPAVLAVPGVQWEQPPMPAMAPPSMQAPMQPLLQPPMQPPRVFEAPVAPMVPFPAVAPRLAEMPSWGGNDWTPRPHHSDRPREAWSPDDPADSLYKAAREVLNRGDYRQAASTFRQISQRFPRSDYAPDALYWEAYALYYMGGTDELRSALKALDARQSKYPDARTQVDVRALAMRVQGALAARGDASAAQAIEREAAQGNASCDREDLAVRSEALNALIQTDPDGALPIIRRVLARRDECSAGLRRTAIFLAVRKGDSVAADILADVVKNETNADVRNEAVSLLARVPGDRALATLEEILKTSNDERMQRNAVRALNNHASPRARTVVRQLIERNDISDNLRSEAISSFAGDRATTDDAAYLRSLYARIDRPALKSRILSTVARIGGTENEQWVASVARNQDEPTELRRYAISALGTKMAIGDILKMYDTVGERRLREQLIELYAYRKEPEAADKLIEIVKNGTDPQLRRQAISALTRKNDPRTTKLLLEIIDKQ
jgi:HEAT repeat protein